MADHLAISATKLPGLKIGVAVDNARISEKAFHLGIALVDKSRGDRLMLLNISEPDQKAGGQSGHEHVKRQYQSLCIDHRVDLDWNHRQRNIVREANLMAALNNLAEELGIDFLVCGCNSVDDNGQVMIVGEMCDSSFWKKDTIVVKNTSFEVTQPLKFLLATDSSAPSKLAFQRACALLKPEDSLVLLNVSSRNEPAPLLWQHYEAEMKRLHIKGSTMYVQSSSVSQAILQTARDLQADMLIVGAVPKSDGLGLGSVSRDLLIDCRCSFLLVRSRESSTTEGSLSKPGTQYAGQAREWGRTDSSSMGSGGLPGSTSGGGWPAPNRASSRGEAGMAGSLTPKRASRDSTGSTGSVEDKMSLLEMFEEQKRQHQRQSSRGGGGGSAAGASPGAHKGPSGGHLSHIQSGVILQAGDTD